MSNEEKQRTLPQNNSLHKYLTELSIGLNDAGFSQLAVMREFKSDFNLPWTMNSLKEVFREIGLIMFDKKSTADLTTIELQEIYRVFSLRFGEISGVSVEWPSEERIQYEKDGYHKVINEKI